MSPALSRHLVGALLATSGEAEGLLDRFPRMVRSLAVATIGKAQRFRGEIRGPVLWGETMGARSATFGDPGLFVCALPEKAYDTLENQVLVAALRVVRDAGHEGQALLAYDIDDDMARRARHNAHRAILCLDHRALETVTPARVSGRGLRRTRSAFRRRVYGPALNVLERAGTPITPDQVALYTDERTAAYHRLALTVLEELDKRSSVGDDVRVVEGGVRAGPLTFRHPAHSSQERPAGVLLHDVPVADDADIEALVDSVGVGRTRRAPAKRSRPPQ